MQKQNSSSKKASPVIFTGCEMTNGMQAAAGGQRRHVSVNGKRVKTIDVHAHCIVPEAFALAGKTAADHQFPDLDEVGSKRQPFQGHLILPSLRTREVATCRWAALRDT